MYRGLYDVLAKWVLLSSNIPLPAWEFLVTGKSRLSTTVKMFELLFFNQLNCSRILILIWLFNLAELLYWSEVVLGVALVVVVLTVAVVVLLNNGHLVAH